MDLTKLKEPLSYRWKVQSFTKDKTKASCVAYIDARDAMDMLDSVCGAENWQRKYYQVKNTMLCSVGIKIGDEWVWKDDGGAESAFDKEKGELSDSFKRACVNWGIGRFLYDLEIKWIPCKPAGNTAFPVDNNGQRIYDLTKHFQDSQKTPQNAHTATEAPKPNIDTKMEMTDLIFEDLSKHFKKDDTVDDLYNRLGLKYKINVGLKFKITKKLKELQDE